MLTLGRVRGSFPPVGSFWALLSFQSLLLPAWVAGLSRERAWQVGPMGTGRGEAGPCTQWVGPQFREHLVTSTGRLAPRKIRSLYCPVLCPSGAHLPQCL